MKHTVPEFSRPIEVARVGVQGSRERISADDKECTALSRRLQLPGVYAVSADLNLRPWRGGGYKVTGEVTADIDQVSVVSLETFRSTVHFPVERYFLSHGGEDSEDDIDVIANGEIDLGELAAETLGLELDPYPRKPGEAFASDGSDIGAEGEEAAPAKVSPFAVLKDRDKNGGKS
jgi:uncharacterized metal-binding protein YceD (DUF177 family)